MSVLFIFSTDTVLLTYVYHETRISVVILPMHMHYVCVRDHKRSLKNSPISCCIVTIVGEKIVIQLDENMQGYAAIRRQDIMI